MVAKEKALAIAHGAAEKGLQALSNDLMVVRKHYPSKVGEDVDVEAHINPLGIGLGLMATAVFAGLAFGRLAIPSLLGGEVELYKGPLFDEWDEWTRIRRTMNTSRALLMGATSPNDLDTRWNDVIKAIEGLGGIDENRKTVLIDQLAKLYNLKRPTLTKPGDLECRVVNGEIVCRAVHY